ncbi:TPA: HAMP domain-containing histidine kinase [Vibrio vulnificus]|nr:HAMP domain-containing histidine kinase [Vibrio vulnificus]EHT4873965.1 hypothetical protein [Vibrio vulnificus]EHU4798533.1 hypothetical protein [Vibrio vulnificus]EHZ2494023.1 hypothetical protein [Vibrio vulnificus]EIA0803609.1 hypothetical protein [Vibrio vulnificus]
MAKKRNRKKGLSLQSKIVRQVVGLKKKTSPKTTRLKLSSTRGLPEKEALHQLSNMLAEPELRDRAIDCKFPTDFHIKSNLRYMDSPHGLDFDIAFECQILKSFSFEISRFVELSDEYDALILLSDLDGAEVKLKEIFDSFGYSNWYISSKLNLFYEKGLHSESELFRNEVIDFFSTNGSDSLSEVYSNYPFIRCDKSVSFERYSFSIQHQSEEFGAKGNNDLIYFSHFFSPATKYDDYSNVISENSASNIVDRFLGFRRVLYSLFLNNVKLFKYLDSIEGLAREVNDKPLKNISALITKSNAIADSFDQELLKVCDLYVEGKYGDVVVESERILSLRPNFVSINEIYIKSLIRCGLKSSLNNLLGDIFNEIIGLYTTSDKRKSIVTLQKYYLRFYHTDWSYFIKLHCDKFSHGPEQFNVEKLYGYIDIYSSLFNPFTKLENSLDLEFKNISQRVLLNPDESLDSFDLVDENRRLKIIGDSHYKDHNFGLSIEYYDELSRSSDFLFYEHAQSKLISCYYNLGLYDKAIHSLSRLIVDGKGQNLLPVKEIYDYIYKEDKSGLSELELIDRAIVCDQYYRLLGNKDGEILGLICEDILDLMEIEDANSIKIPDGEEFTYFFSEVLSPAALEKIDIFESSEEVYIFRFYIIKTLLIKMDDSELREDLFRNLEKLIKETCITECGLGKIEVDFLSVKSGLIKLLSNTFDSLKISEKKKVSDSDYTEVVTKKGTFTVSNNEYFVDILDFYLQVRDVFTLSPTNGLDYFLNMNIRHGGIVNLLWGPAKKHNLCYLKTDKGHFEKNQYWFDQNPYMTPNTRTELDNAFREFSIGLDKKIQEIKSYIHINTGEFNDNEKAFNYFTDQDFIERLINSITKDSLVEDIVEEIIDNLIEITDESLASLKEYIDGAYRSGINQLFDTLKGVVVASRYRFEELTRIIRLAQREINEKVDELMDWMEWKNEASQSFLLGSSVDAAKEMILELHPNRQVNIEFQDINKKFIKGEHFRKFVMIFLILIDNAVVHTKEEEVASLSINVDSKDNVIMLTIANKIDPDDNRISVEKIKVINEKINSAYIDDANKESGSGLFKIKKVISNDIKVDNIIELELAGLDFSVAIRMDEGGIFDEIY